MPLNPQVCIDPPSPKKIVKISKKYISDPPSGFPTNRVLRRRWRILCHDNDDDDDDDDNDDDDDDDDDDEDEDDDGDDDDDDEDDDVDNLTRER